jgi:hypothetical protein
MSHPLINKLTKERDKLTAQIIIAKERETLALSVAAQWELKASMVTSIFRQEMFHIKEDMENARTLSELKKWLQEDVLEKWASFMLSADELDDLTQDDFVEKAKVLTSKANIKFDTVKLMETRDKIRKEYGL